MVDPTDANAGYDGFLEGVAAGEATYRECANGHGSLPPRRACPRCGDTTLSDVPLPETGRIETYTEVHVTTPQLEADAPYLTAIARFGPVQVTGFLRGVAPDEATVGSPVRLAVESTTDGEQVLVLRPA